MGTMHDMENEIPNPVLGNDVYSLLLVLARVQLVRGELDECIELLGIYSAMQNQADKKIVLRSFLVLREEVHINNLVSQINSSLPSVKNSALVMQFDKLRDNLREDKQLLDSWEP